MLNNDFIKDKILKGFLNAFRFERGLSNSVEQPLLQSKVPTYITKESVVNGNVSGIRVEARNAEIIGDVAAVDFLYVDKGSIKGSITTASADLNGVIDGNITASELLVIQQNAVITGDIKSASVSVAQNAVIDGKITIDRNPV